MNLERLRKAAGLSLRELAAALEKIGRPIHTDGINRAERGTRRVDVDELVALAYVLGVAPSSLLLPPAADGDIEVTGAGRVPAAAAWDWVDGRAPLRAADDDGSAAAAFQLRGRPEGRRQFDIGMAARDA